MDSNISIFQYFSGLPNVILRTFKWQTEHHLNHSSEHSFVDQFLTNNQPLTFPLHQLTASSKMLSLLHQKKIHWHNCHFYSNYLSKVKTLCVILYSRLWFLLLAKCTDNVLVISCSRYDGATWCQPSCYNTSMTS